MDRGRQRENLTSENLRIRLSLNCLLRLLHKLVSSARLQAKTNGQGDRPGFHLELSVSQSDRAMHIP